MDARKVKIAAIVGGGIFLVGVLAVYALVRSGGSPRASGHPTSAPAAEPVAMTPEPRPSEVGDLIRQCRQDIATNRFPEALAIIDKIIELDPTNDYANAVRPLVKDRAALQMERRQLGR